MAHHQNAILSLKQCRIILAVAKCRSESEASQELFLTQSNISRNISAAESALGVSLFKRGWGGADPTPEGEIVISTCRQIVNELDRTQDVVAATANGATSFTTYIEWRHLDVVLAVVNLGSASAAVNEVGLSQPAISRALKDIERMCRQPLFTRRKLGLEPNDAARALALLQTIITPMLQSLNTKLQEVSNEVSGRLYVGMLPISCQHLVPRAFTALIEESSRIQLHAMQAPYRMLTKSLRNGEIDCFIGLSRDLPRTSDLLEIPLMPAKYCVIANSNHPIHSTKIQLQDLKSQKWMVAPHGTPIRAYFEHLSDLIGETVPAQTIEMLTFSSAEQMIQYSSAIGLLVYANQDLNKLRDGIKKLDIDLPNADCMISLTVRKDQKQKIVDRFLAILKSYK